MKNSEGRRIEIVIYVSGGGWQRGGGGRRSGGFAGKHRPVGGQRGGAAGVRLQLSDLDTEAVRLPASQCRGRCGERRSPEDPQHGSPVGHRAEPCIEEPANLRGAAGGANASNDSGELHRLLLPRPPTTATSCRRSREREKENGEIEGEQGDRSVTRARKFIADRRSRGETLSSESMRASLEFWYRILGMLAKITVPRK